MRKKFRELRSFIAGTTRHDDAYFTSGGRVLGITAREADLEAAVNSAYEAASKIGFGGAYYRKDIAARALKK